ncbi:MAG: hypothetical protein GY710_25620 [Desulfobacteraceae bacterium]|nr:hypothetical protein [Desulfobacteraceae bacterium]
MKKNWRIYPHFFVATGSDARSARFDVDDVLLFLKNRDYEWSEDGTPRPKEQGQEQVDRRFKNKRIQEKTKKWFSQRSSRTAMGARKTLKTSQSGTSSDPIENFKSGFGVS